MKNKKNNGGISIANIIAMVGLALLLVFSWLGLALRNGEIAGMSIILSVIITAVAGLLLWLMIKAKGAETNLTQWRVVEYATLAVYIVAAVLTAPIALHFFSVLLNKSELQETARNDIQGFNEQIESFKHDEVEILNTTITGLNNAWGNNYDSDVQKFFEDNGISNSADIGSFEEKWDKMIRDIRVEDKSYDGEWKSDINNALKAIDDWQLLKMPAATGIIKSLSEKIGGTLTEFSEKTPFATLEMSDDGSYKLKKENQSGDYAVSAEYPEKMKSLSPYTVIGIIAVVLIHAIILFSYFVSNRSRRVGLKANNSNDGGVVLRF